MYVQIYVYISFYMGLAFAKHQKHNKQYFIGTMKILQTHCVVNSCRHLISPRLSLCVYFDIYGVYNNIKISCQFLPTGGSK